MDNSSYKRAKNFRKLKRQLWLSFLLLPPALILITFIFLPMASALLYSVYDWNGLIRGDFVGLENMFSLVSVVFGGARQFYTTILELIS